MHTNKQLIELITNKRAIKQSASKAHKQIKFLNKKLEEYEHILATISGLVIYKGIALRIAHYGASSIIVISSPAKDVKKFVQIQSVQNVNKCMRFICTTDSPETKTFDILPSAMSFAKKYMIS